MSDKLKNYYFRPFTHLLAIGSKYFEKFRKYKYLFKKSVYTVKIFLNTLIKFLVDETKRQLGVFMLINIL